MADLESIKNEGGSAETAMQTGKPAAEKMNPMLDWVLRLLKGILVGIGAIVPGLSGGVLAVVFGIYEPLLRFLANIRYKFVQNVRYFLPVGIGGVVGVVGFAAVVDYAFTHFAAQFTWLFIGFIAGTFPSLYTTSGKEGRKIGHWAVLVLMAIGTYFFMRWGETVSSLAINPNFWIWLGSGALVGLGLIVPGMSPSNFLIYLGLYQPMASGIRQLDLGVVIPITLGLIVCVLVFAKVANWLFKKAYAFMYHFILGIVIGSTAAIIPSGVTGIGVIAVCVVLFLLGGAASYGLALVDERHPHESIF